MRKIIIIIFCLVTQHLIAGEVITLDHNSFSIVYSKVNNKLYALIDAMDPEYGNRLIEINVNNGAIERSMFICSQPWRIRLTPDENFAWISSSAVPFMHRVNLTTFQIDKKVYLGPSQQDHGPNQKNSFVIAFNFTVLPGDKDKLALGLKDQGWNNFEAYVLYKNDTIQPKRIVGDTFIYEPYSVEPLHDGDFLIGHKQTSGSSTFSTIRVLENGLEYMDHYEGLAIPGLRINYLKVHNDTVYLADGTILDASDSNDLEVIGVCENDIIDDIYGFTFSEIHNAFIYPNMNDNSIYLTFYDKNSCIAFDSVFLMDYPNSQFYMITHLEVISNDRFAITLLSKYLKSNIYIVQTNWTGIEDVLTNENILTYPNPTSDKLHISGLPDNNCIYIYDISGRLIETVVKGGNNINLNVSNYCSGTYILKIEDLDNKTDHNIIKKIVIE